MHISGFTDNRSIEFHDKHWKINSRIHSDSTDRGEDIGSLRGFDAHGQRNLQGKSATIHIRLNFMSLR